MPPRSRNKSAATESFMRKLKDDVGSTELSGVFKSFMMLILTQQFVLRKQLFCFGCSGRATKIWDLNAFFLSAFANKFPIFRHLGPKFGRAII